MASGRSSSSSSSSDESGILNFFEEEEGYYQQEKPAHIVHYQLSPHKSPLLTPCSKETSDLSLRVVGEHPLWAHHIWNASLIISEIIHDPMVALDHSVGNDDERLTQLLCRLKTVHNKRVLELGAGAALPSIMCGREGSSFVMATDYPDQELLENIKINVKQNLSSTQRKCVHVVGHLWGKEIESLRREAAKLAKHQNDKEVFYFDLIILSDLLFNHSQHIPMLDSLSALLHPHTGIALVAFTHHLPQYKEKDLNFFTLAHQKYSLLVHRLPDRIMKPMFKDDPGCEKTRSTINIY
eukprot:CAMPEP_0201549952 /NCGR_PEP_ID=MMETSP0173_2-20130828/6374_1 /ASSEMBLY_ACC=CAM_ASM_000268 /TAXON_ID=218659 /ORGANISM="Vexillifera sp., Strain DIVA3 564/2" /LENGTH=295 /DNA_ID=CAMNT_0047959799 /DNA_START=327 /DNA_END=1211 /DNA_ORIENTATION=+